MKGEQTVYDKRLAELALAYEHVLLELSAQLRGDDHRTLHVFEDLLAQYHLKDQIDLLTLIFMGKFQDAEMELEPKERFRAYRSKVKSLIGKKRGNKYLIRPEDQLHLEVASWIATGVPDVFGDTRMSRGIEMASAPIKASSEIPYSCLHYHFANLREYVLVNDISAR